MPDSVDIESDPSLVQLTDALRAGPGSPQWHEAVLRLRRDGMEGSEQAMLIAVREHLESGKEYRTVRAGPGFTRKLMERLDEEPPGKRRAFPLAAVVAFVGGLAIVGLMAALVIVFLPKPEDRLSTEIAQLRDGNFPRTITQASFDGAPLTDWADVGPLKVDTNAGLRPATTHPSNDYRTAAIESKTTVLATDVAAMEALVVPPADGATIVQLYVKTVQPTAANGSDVELAWVLQGGKSRVALPGGRFTDTASAFNAGREGALVRISISGHTAVVSVGGREMYAGVNDLPLGSPRTFGIRFLTKGGRATDGIVLSARVVQP